MSDMREWLTKSLSACALTEDVEDYLLSRGAQPDSYEAMGASTWSPPEDPAPCADFRKRYGPRGERIRGCLVVPFHTPSGNVVGFEARRTDKKWITDYRIMPESKWLPVWLGTQKSMPKIWEGGHVWVVEGLFDLFAMEWVVPEGDVVLASVRAALSYAHVQFLSRFASFVHIVYDEDQTGQEGSEKALFFLHRVGVLCRAVRFHGGKDPGEIWDRSGEEGLRRVFKVR